MTAELAARFAREWIDAWNSHDIERILLHYADGVTYHSPFVARLAGNVDGALQGKAALSEYFVAGLAAYPDLRFRLRAFYVGVGSVVLEYDSVSELIAAETFVLDASARAIQVFCHYRNR
jgi:hypothetical protein